MNQLSKELLYLRELMTEMMDLVKAQMNHSKEAIFNLDLGLAESILRTESRVNALELNIEKECENSIALYQPVATDLRLVLSIFKSVSDLERIGDHARFFCKNIIERTEAFDPKLLEALEMEITFAEISQMFDELNYALNSQDTSVARNVFRTDKAINKRFKKVVVYLNEEIAKCNSSKNDYLLLYSFYARLERTANLLTNIAEEIIFHVEARIIKHNKEAKKELRK